MEKFVRALYIACLKANSIAVACRQKPELLNLLTQEKEKNAKFDQDFKTLADVLIQEVVRYELSKFSLQLGKQIYGEESDTFTNSVGQTVKLELNDNEQNSRKLLAAVLDGNEDVASSLASEAHKIVDVPTEVLQQIESLEKQEVDYSQIGIWIDPIDGTSHYIKGTEQLDENGYPLKGLQVAKVLIGAYDLKTGCPVAGIVGSPFSCNLQLMFGCCFNNKTSVLPQSYIKNLTKTKSERPKIVIGSSESPELLSTLQKNFQVFSAGGAGHKIMMLVDGVADIYINSTPSVYYWDTCGPHAILKAIGGDILTFTHFKEIIYNDAEVSGSVHEHGIVAFIDPKHLDLLKSTLSK